MIRKDADAETAAKFQIAFKRAGARLRVVTVDVEPEQAERATRRRMEPNRAVSRSPQGRRQKTAVCASRRLV